MSEYVIQGQTLTSIADAIRGKLETEQQYTPESMAAAIGRIQGVDAPEESILKISAVGTGLASVSPSAAGKMQGLTLYGRSWQDGTPSVETEVPIEDAGQDGQIDVTVCGANMANQVSQDGIITFKAAPYPDARSVIVAKNIPAGTYIWNYDSFYSLDGGIQTLLCYASKKSGESQYSIKANVPFTVNQMFALIVYVQENDGRTYSVTNLMLCAGDTIQPYQPYTAQQLPIPTPDGLPGIPVDSGGNWVDENGQQWVSDVVDLAAGTKTKIVNRLIVNRAVGITNQRQKDPNYYGCEFNAEQILTNYASGAMCSKLQFAGVNANINGPQFTIVQGNGFIVYGIPKNLVPEETKDAVNAYLVDNPIEILYIGTPIVTPLTDEELAAYRAIQSYPGTTNVLAPDCGIEATAYGNAAEYISQHTAIQDAAQAAKILLGMEE